MFAVDGYMTLLRLIIDHTDNKVVLPIRHRAAVQYRISRDLFFCEVSFLVEETDRTVQ